MPPSLSAGSAARAGSRACWAVVFEGRGSGEEYTHTGELMVVDDPSRVYEGDSARRDVVIGHVPQQEDGHTGHGKRSHVHDQELVLPQIRVVGAESARGEAPVSDTGRHHGEVGGDILGAEFRRGHGHGREHRLDVLVARKVIVL